MQCLCLQSDAGIHSLCADSLDMADRVKRACWAVYCIDKTHALRWRSFTVRGIEKDVLGVLIIILTFSYTVGPRNVSRIRSATA